jgi:Uma2 family endonuclease
MAIPAHRIHYTWAEYLALEASSNVKHEYLDGQIYGRRSPKGSRRATDSGGHAP